MPRQGRERDLQKEQFWRDIIQCQQQSDRSIRAFCAEQGLSEQSFHAWRRTIALRDQPPPAALQEAQPARERPAFLPVRVLPATTTAVLEVVATSGRVVRVPPGFDAAALRRLLAALEEAPSC